MIKKSDKKPIKKPRSKTTITNEIIQQVEELAKQGFNNTLISQSLGIALATLSRNSQLSQSIQRGKLELAKEVTSTMLDTLSINATNQQLLVKRLGLFNPSIDIKKPNNAKEALENLSTATKQFADGLISESQLRTIEAVSNSYIKGHDNITLEERLTAIEKILKDKYEK